MTHEGVAMRYRRANTPLYRALSAAFGRGARPSPGTKISGQGSTRDEALEKAKKSIARAIQKHRFKQGIDGED
jgi:hypothetical protein